MSKSVAVFRPVITTDEILGTLEALSTIPAMHMPSGARALIAKFRIQALKIDAGIAKPAYIQSGSKQPSIHNLTVDDLGGYNSENTLSSNVAASLFTSNSNSNMQPITTNSSAELDPSTEAELLAMEAAMLAEVASNGAGSDNVISERRKHPRNLDDETSCITSADL